MIRAIFFDLDGTLLDSNKRILLSSVEALKDCRERGIRLFVCTARSPRLEVSLGWSDREFSLFDGGIYCNGTCIMRENGCEYAFMPRDIVEFCIKKTEEYANLHIALSLESETHAFNHDVPEKAWKFWNVCGEKVLKIDSADLERIPKLLMYYDNMMDSEKPLPDELFCEIHKCCGGRASAYHIDGGRTIQVTAADKVWGIERVRCELGLTKDEIAVFGDSTNDVEMLREYKCSVAMGNGAESAKVAARFVTGTNDEDGIADAIRIIIGE